MNKLIEFIPNFSEGTNNELLTEFANTAKSVEGVMLMDYSADKNHNRSVFTLAGCPEGIEMVAFRLAKLAVDKIDLTKHKGEHPRMGAVDVMPFVPIKNATIKECVELSKRVAKQISDELCIPVFLYEESATAENRRNLADIRKGQFEGMEQKLLQPEWNPDYGTKLHPTAGVVAIGARRPLVAFNVNLDTSDVNIAKNIAKAVRGSSGGYKYCKALGIMLTDCNTAQVSMNFVNHDETPIYRVFEAIKFEAKRYGVTIIGSELIGLAPAKALIDCAEYYLRLENFDFKTQVIENHLLE